jgi:rod shape determining protein RodA
MMTIQKPAKSNKPFHIDLWLTVLLIIMAIISLMAIYGSIPITPSWIDGQSILIKQALWYILGFSLLAFLLYFGIDRLFTGVKVFYWILLVMLVILILDFYINIPFVTPINGSRAWFILPGIGTIQPSEFMKIVLILLSANIIHEHNEFKTKMSFKDDFHLFYKIAKVVTVPLILIIMQPDTGIPLVIIVSILAMLAISQIKPFWILFGVIMLLILVGGTLYLFEYHPNVLSQLFGAPYRLNRFYGWLHTERYSLTWGNQLYTSLLAVGSAGLTGHGAQATMIMFAEPQNDFIFAVIAKNYGFIGVSLVIIVSLIFNLKLLSIALKFDRPKEQYMVAGLLGMLFFQQFQNMGMIIGILPITGITLPLISAGGSSLLSYMIPLAIIYHMSSENHNRTLH